MLDIVLFLLITLTIVSVVFITPLAALQYALEWVVDKRRKLNAEKEQDEKEEQSSKD